MTERRTLCLMCAGRCDADKYTCRRCNCKLWQQIADAQAVDVWRAAYREEKP